MNGAAASRNNHEIGAGRTASGQVWGNLSPAGRVTNSEFQCDKVKELKKAICLFGMENRFKRKKT